MRRSQRLWRTAIVAALMSAAVTEGRGQSHEPVRLTQVSVSRDGGVVTVVLRGSSPLPPVAVVRTTEGAPRLFVDLAGVLPGAVPTRLDGAGPVRRVRIAPHTLVPPVTRVVLDLAGAVGVGVVPSGAASNDVTIAVTAVSAVSGSGAGAGAARTDAPPPAASARSAAAGVAPVQAPVVGAAPPAVASTSLAAETATPPPVSPASPPPQLPAAPRPTSGWGGAPVPRPTGRIAVYGSGVRASSGDGPATGYGDVTTAVSYSFLDRDSDGVEFGLDLRHAAYSIAGRQPRVSIYSGFLGARLADGHAYVRAGHLWIDDLGSLGAVAGAQVEARSAAIPATGLGRWRGGLFGGLDPNVYRLGYGDGVRKAGAYAVLEGARGRRHVAGYVNVHNGDQTERSVLSIANFVPAGPLFVYQVAEYDLSPVAGGLGHDGLSYFFSNARLSLHRRVELQATVSRGRSVDVRGLSDDIQAGRAVTQQSLDGLRYSSLGGRLTTELPGRVRVYAGYSRDRNNRDDVASGRWLAGGYATNVLGSGLDLTLSDSHITRPGGTYHSTYMSAGRELGSRVYTTVEFSTALSRLRFTRGDGVTVETAPSTRRFGANANWQLWRTTSAFLSAERTVDGDDYREWRALTGLTVRLR